MLTAYQMIANIEIKYLRGFGGFRGFSGKKEGISFEILN